MALIKFGGGIVQMAGSIAGNTFARNRYGNYVRARTKPTNPNTDRQTSIRSAMADITTRWAQTLTSAQRTAWNLYGSNVVMQNRLGESMNLSGFNHYIRSNVVRKAFGLALVDAGPTTFELPAQDSTLAITASEATQDISTAYDDTMDWAAETGSFMVLFAGQPQTAQRNFFAGPWRSFAIVSGVDAAPPAGPSVAASPYAIAETQHIWVYARILRLDGRMSEKFRDDVAVGA